MSKKTWIAAALLSGTSAAGGACGPLGETSLEVFEPNPVETPYALGPDFASVLHLLRLPASDGFGCSTDCHTDVTVTAGISFEGGDQKVYDEIIAGGTSGSAVNLTSPAFSALLVKPTQAEGNTHPRQPIRIDTDEYEAILGWIAAGAVFE